MKTKRSLLLPALLGSVLAMPVRAAPIDIASFLGLEPGQWAVFRDAGTGQLDGYVASQGANGVVDQTWYRFDGQAWVFDSVSTFSLSALRLSLISEGDGSDVWTFEPPITLPRRMHVDQPVVYKGVARSQNTGQTVAQSFASSITATGIDVSVPAGSFTGCIKLRMYTYGGGGSRDSVSISCPGRAEVKAWHSKIKDSADPTAEDQSDVHSGVMIQAGDSNAPIP